MRHQISFLAHNFCLKRHNQTRRARWRSEKSLKCMVRANGQSAPPKYHHRLYLSRVFRHSGATELQSKGGLITACTRPLNAALLKKRPFGFAKPEGSSFTDRSAQAHSACCAFSILAHVSFRLTERLNTSLPPAGSENCLLTNVPFLIHYWHGTDPRRACTGRGLLPH